MREKSWMLIASLALGLGAWPPGLNGQSIEELEKQKSELKERMQGLDADIQRRREAARPAQDKALREFITRLGKEYGVELKETFGHRCPCRLFAAFRKGERIGELETPSSTADAQALRNLIGEKLQDLLRSRGLHKAPIEFKTREAVYAMIGKYHMRLDEEQGILLLNPAGSFKQLDFFDGRTTRVTLTAGDQNILRVLVRNHDGTGQSVLINRGTLEPLSLRNLPPGPSQ